MNSDFKTTDDVYRFVKRLMTRCRENGATELHNQLDDALHLGSSGLEICGAIREVLVNNRDRIAQVLGPGGEDETNQAICVVDRIFGR